MDKVGSIWEVSVLSSQLYYKTKTALKKLNHWEFPGGSMVRTSCSHCRSTGLMPGLMVALRSQGHWRWEGPLGTPLGLVHWKRASSPVEAGTAGYL